MSTDKSRNVHIVNRWQANMLGLWGLCARPACRRARDCRGDAGDCMRRYVPLVPEEACDGADLLLEGRRAGLTFDEVREESPDEVDAVVNWMELVHQSAERR